MSSDEGPRPATTFHALSSILWKERDLLELLLFKLEEEHLVVAAGRTRWLVHATREVELVLERLRQVELERAIVLEQLPAQTGVRDASTLDALAAATAAPWPRIFRQHRDALLELAHEIRVTARANRDALASGHEATRDALCALGVDDLHVELVEERL